MLGEQVAGQQGGDARVDTNRDDPCGRAEPRSDQVADGAERSDRAEDTQGARTGL
jgi:hypothetical protein